MKLYQVVHIQSTRKSHRQEQEKSLGEREEGAALSTLEVGEEGQDQEGNQRHEDHTWVEQCKNDCKHAESKLRDGRCQLCKERETLAADALD